MKILGLIVAYVILLALGSIWGGYVLSVLWGWFIVPTFHLVSLSIPLAIGIELVIRLFTYQTPTQSDGNEKKSGLESVVYSTILAFLPPLLYLGFGAVVHAFV